MSFLVGVLRGLRRLGVMDTVDLVTAVSGASWAAAPYFFADRTDEELLGSPTSPPELTLDFLGKPGSQIGASLNRSFAPVIAGLLAERTPLSELWSRFVGEMFLAPFDLGSPGVYLAKTAEDVERIKRENPKLRKARFATPRPGLPELVICAALLAPQGYASGPESAVSLQISPDVAGSPFYPAGAAVNYSRRCNATGKKESISRLVGGGLVETFALGGAQPAHAEAQRGGRGVEVGAPSTPFSLVDAVGASSWNAGAEVAGSLLGSATNPLLEYWPVTSEAMPGPQAAEKYQLGDGGIVDLSGLLPLLQRGVPSVIWVAAAAFGLNASFPRDESCSCGASCATDFDAVAAGLQRQVADKFGYGPQLSSATNYHLMNQVFEKKEMRLVACELWDLVKAGKPAVIDLQLQVMSNSFWGIAGGETVQVKLLYSVNSAEFVQSLPDPTRIQIHLGDDGMFPHFPYYRSMWEQPTTLPQINLLSALGEYYAGAAYPSAR